MTMRYSHLSPKNLRDEMEATVAGKRMVESASRHA